MRYEKIRYFLRSAQGWLDRDRRKCPNCGNDQSRIVKRKYCITVLVRCAACEILYRIPTDPERFAEDYYQNSYESGFTTDCPKKDELEQLKKSQFKGTAKDFLERIRFVRALQVPTGARILDFGASWGYGTWQFTQSGYEVVGYEISRPRARYAREHLGQNVVDDLQAIEGKFDVFFSCHVLEHVPSIQQVLELGKHVLRPGGLFIAFTPNGSKARYEKNPQRYHRTWGAVHPLYLDEQFYRKCLNDVPKLICTSPYNWQSVSQWDQRSDVILDTSGEELLVAAAL